MGCIAHNCYVKVNRFECRFHPFAIGVRVFRLKFVEAVILLGDDQCNGRLALRRTAVSQDRLLRFTDST
jgi:hypothetical protein